MPTDKIYNIINLYDYLKYNTKYDPINYNILNDSILINNIHDNKELINILELMNKLELQIKDLTYINKELLIIFKEL